MSSPGHRRQRSSQSATPRRSSQRNAIPSSPPDPAAAQLQNEAASSQGGLNGTPRRVAPSSSPMMYRSSPADIARANRERDISSPLRQMTNSQPTQDGERTPRASGLIGGMYSRCNKCPHSNQMQNLHPSDMPQALVPTAAVNNRSSLIFRVIAVVVFSCGNLMLALA